MIRGAKCFMRPVMEGISSYFLLVEKRKKPCSWLLNWSKMHVIYSKKDLWILLFYALQSSGRGCLLCLFFPSAPDHGHRGLFVHILQHLITQSLLFNLFPPDRFPHWWPYSRKRLLVFWFRVPGFWLWKERTNKKLEGERKVTWFIWRRFDFHAGLSVLLFSVAMSAVIGPHWSPREVRSELKLMSIPVSGSIARVILIWICAELKIGERGLGPERFLFCRTIRKAVWMVFKCEQRTRAEEIKTALAY